MPGAQCRHQRNHISKGLGQETLPEAVVKSAGQGTPSSLLTSQPHCMKTQNTPTVYRLSTVPTAHSHTIVQSHFTPSHNRIAHYTVTPHTLPLHSHTLHHLCTQTHLTPPGTQTYLTPSMHTDAPHTPCTHNLIPSTVFGSVHIITWTREGILCAHSSAQPECTLGAQQIINSNEN